LKPLHYQVCSVDTIDKYKSFWDMIRVDEIVGNENTELIAIFLLYWNDSEIEILLSNRFSDNDRIRYIDGFTDVLDCFVG
jgi:hypothetical protein